jgi:hypothetical protein
MARQKLTLGGREVNDVAITLEHVDLLDGLDRLGVQLLESGLELLVIIGAAGDIALLLVSGSTLSTWQTKSYQPCDSFQSDG